MNERMTYPEYIELTKEALTFQGIVPGFGSIVTIYGRLALPAEDGFILFDFCDYCGTHERPQRNLLNDYSCVKCGAPVR